jgi:hypothetical protein
MCDTPATPATLVRADQGGPWSEGARLGRPRRQELAIPNDETLLRIRLPDRPGSLALVTGRLASYGVDIVRLEVVEREPGSVIDDLVVRGGDPVRALEELQPRIELLVAARSPAAEDAGLQMADICQRLVAAPDADALRAELLAGALRVAGATDGDLVPVSLPEVQEALEARRPALVQSGGSRFGDGPALAVPVGDPPALALLLMRRQRLPYLPVELQRVEALATLAGSLLR